MEDKFTPEEMLSFMRKKRRVEMAKDALEFVKMAALVGLFYAMAFLIGASLLYAVAKVLQ